MSIDKGTACHIKQWTLVWVLIGAVVALSFTTYIVWYRARRPTTYGLSRAHILTNTASISFLIVCLVLNGLRLSHCRDFRIVILESVWVCYRKRRVPFAVSNKPLLGLLSDLPNRVLYIKSKAMQVPRLGESLCPWGVFPYHSAHGNHPFDHRTP